MVFRARFDKISVQDDGMKWVRFKSDENASRLKQSTKLSKYLLEIGHFAQEQTCKHDVERMIPERNCKAVSHHRLPLLRPPRPISRHQALTEQFAGHNTPGLISLSNEAGIGAFTCAHIQYVLFRENG